MDFKAYLNRNGGRAAAVAFASALLAVTTLGAAHADNSTVQPTVLSHQLNSAARAAAASVAATPLPPAIAFADPLPGHEVNSPFGLRELETENHARVHEGVDIAAPVGSEIHATASGVVERAGLSPSYGNFVEIDHGDGVTSFYAHMRHASALRPGEKVEAGEVVGKVGSTGHSTGPHLHFEIRKDGRHYDPALFMGRAFKTFAALPFLRSAETGFPVMRQAFHRGADRLASLKGRHSSGGRFHMTMAAR